MSEHEYGFSGYIFSDHANQEILRRELDIDVVRQSIQVLERIIMKIVYDQDVDALTIVFKQNGHVRDSDETSPGVVMDYDETGSLVSIEVMDASTRFEDLDSVQFEKSGAGH